MDAAHKLRSIRKDVRRLPRRRGEARTLLVLGCQRSGTNALVECFELDAEAKVYQERCSLNLPSGRHSPRDSIRYSLRLRPIPEVSRRLARLRYPLAVLKPLVESGRGPELLGGLPGARAVWIFRHYQDVAESNVRVFGADVHRRNLEPIVAGAPDNWRSAQASEEVRRTVARLYRPQMDPIDGGALFWWARNRLLFDRGLVDDDRVAVLQYERFAADPASALAELYSLVGVPFPGARIAAPITPRFVGRGADRPVSPELAALCEPLWARLCERDPAARADRDFRPSAGEPASP